MKTTEYYVDYNSTWLLGWFLIIINGFILIVHGIVTYIYDDFLIQSDGIQVMYITVVGLNTLSFVIGVGCIVRCINMRKTKNHSDF